MHFAPIEIGGLMRRGIGGGLWLLFAMTLWESAQAVCPAITPSNVYGYSDDVISQCRYKTLEEAEVAMHASFPLNELAFVVPGTLAVSGVTGAMLDYRANAAATGALASVLIMPAQNVSPSFSLYVKGWPPPNVTPCQISGCTNGGGCSTAAAEAARVQCEFADTWKSHPAYCWTAVPNGMTTHFQFSQPPTVTTINATTGTLSYIPKSSTDSSSAWIQIEASTGCGYNTVNVATPNSVQKLTAQALAQTTSSQSLQWALSQKINFTCPVGAKVNSNATSTANACIVGLSKQGIRLPSFQETSGHCDGAGNPCFPSTGNKEAHEKGFQYGEIAFDLHYNSLRQTRPQGYIDRNWSHSFAKQILTAWNGAPGRRYVQDEQAHIEEYQADTFPPRRHRSTNTLGNVLQYYPPGGNTAEFWELYYPNGVIDVFDTAGRLIQTVHPDDPRKTLTFTYLGSPINGTYTIDTSHYQEAFWHIGRVTDGNGRFITFNYDDSVQMWLTSIVADDGVTTLMTFGYVNNDNVHRLTSTTQFNTTRQYLYNEPNNIYLTNPPSAAPAGVIGYWLTGIIDENNQRFATYQYDDWGRAIASWHGAMQAGKVTLAYTSDASATVTLPLGNQKTYTYAQESYRHPQQMVDGSGTTQFQYDQITHRKTQTTDPNGNTIKIEYDTRGYHEIARTEGVGKAEQRRIETDWDNGTNRVLARRTFADPSAGMRSLETTTSYAYDATTGHLNSVTQTDPVTSKTRISQYTYCIVDDVPSGCLKGYLQTFHGPRTDVADVTTYSYYTSTLANTYHQGDVKTVTNAAGHVMTFIQYNARGQVLEQLDANGIRTDFSYTARGWLQSRTVRANATGTSAEDATTTFTYDNVGNVTRITQPDGAYLAYTYDDAHRLTEITDNLNNTIHYTLDAAGNRTAEKTYDASSTLKRTLSRQYDQLNRLVTTLNAQNAAMQTYQNPTEAPPAGVIYTNGYDGNGNAIYSVDGLGVGTAQRYDSLNRLVKTLQDHAGQNATTHDATTQYSYDARDNLRRVIDPENLTTAYTYDGLNNLTLLQSPDTGNSTYTYDAAGNRKTQTDARGVISTYSYDALNRLMAISYPTASLNIGYAYDQPDISTGCTRSYPRGRLTTLTDSSGSTTYCYDHRGNVLQKTQVTEGYRFVTRYRYNLADRLMGITYPSGAQVSYSRDAEGRPLTVEVTPPGGTPTSILSEIAWQPFGPASRYTFAQGGQVLTKTYDQNDWVTDVTSNALNLHFARDRLGTINTLGTTPGANPASEQYVYDALYRLTQVQTGAGSSLQDFTYNQSGDRQTRTVTPSPAQTYTYTPNTHRLNGVGGNARRLDATGNTTQITGAATLEFTFDDRNRLTQVTRNATPITRSTYNAKGERVYKSSASDTRWFVYAETGHLLGEYSVNTKQEYLWVDNTPVAMLTITGDALHADDTLFANGFEPDASLTSTVTYIHSDQLDSPRAVTSTSGTTQWSWPWQSNPFGETAPTGAMTLNLRYPGQYYDQETGLNYNYFRDYEPQTGRYIESDPIGLAGGINTYTYVDENPFDGIDPTGLLKIYGNWCGPDWTGGFKKPWNDLTPWEQEHVLPPKNPLDKLCMDHDKCYGNCALNHRCDMKARSSCLLSCDRALIDKSKRRNFWGNVIAVGISIGKPGKHPEDANPPKNPSDCPCGSVDP